MRNRPYIVTIAGFDPSAGAGILADIKTFEALRCYGLAVMTANTIQNDIEFKHCNWNDIEEIKDQIAILFKRYKIEYVKIGIVQNWKMLNELIDFLIKKNKQIKIIVDPVLRSSSDFDFHKTSSETGSENGTKSYIHYMDMILRKIYLLTPNYEEINQLYKEKTIEETIDHISSRTNLFLKGGHREDSIGKDELFTTDKKQYALNPKNHQISEKHGSGCVLSSAITGQLALGFPLLKACFRGKRYTEKVLSSNKSLLGYHKL